MPGFTRLRCLALIATAMTGCSIVMPSTNTPVDAVRQYVSSVAAHELASLRVCSRPYPHGYSRLLIGGLFEPVQALPGFDEARTVSLIEIDISRLTFEQVSTNGSEAEVEIGGVLVERFDPPAVEALFRAYAREAGQPVDDALLRETLENVSSGPIELGVREIIPVVKEGATWQACPHPFTP